MECIGSFHLDPAMYGPGARSSHRCSMCVFTNGLLDFQYFPPGRKEIHKRPAPYSSTIVARVNTAEGARREGFHQLLMRHPTQPAQVVDSLYNVQTSRHFS
jgi:hypothetical protein